MGERKIEHETKKPKRTKKKKKNNLSVSVCARACVITKSTKLTKFLGLFYFCSLCPDLILYLKLWPMCVVYKWTILFSLYTVLWLSLILNYVILLPARDVNKSINKLNNWLISRVFIPYPDYIIIYTKIFHF